MVSAAHSEEHGRPAGNGGDLSKRGWCCGSRTRSMGTRIAGRRPTAGNGSRSRFPTARRKTGHSGDHRLWRGVGHRGGFRRNSFGCRWGHRHSGDRLRQRGRRRPGRRKTGHRGDHRLRRGFRRANGGVADVGQRVAVHRDDIELGLSRGRNAMAIWQDLVDTRGFTGGYQSVKRFVRKLAGGSSKEACAVIETAAGEEAQVDYGTGPMVRDPHSGKYRRMRLFVLTLGYSRKSVRLLVFQSSTQTWAELHEKAFRRLGGCTRVVVLDNLGEGVLKPDIYDPTINPVYADMLRHYGVVAMPC